MSTFVLKLIAIITMLIDHVGAGLVNPNAYPELWTILRIIGRLAFPIFCFLLVEGLYHTSNVKKYLIRLGAFAMISEIPFDLAFHNTVLEFSSQNVFFTLCLGLAAIYLINLVEVKYGKQIFISNILDAVITIAFCVLSYLLQTDYVISGILMIVAFYMFRGNKALILLSLLVVNTMPGITIQIFAVAAAIPIFFYNGKKGKSAKYLFYIFYPAHLLIIYFIKAYFI